MGIKDKIEDWHDENVIGDASGPVATLFWFSVLLHIVLMAVWFLLNINQNTLFYLFITVYAFIAIRAFWVFRREGELDDAKSMVIVIIVGIFYTLLPFFLYLIPPVQMTASTTLYDWVVFAIIVFPIWPIYLGLKANIGFIHFYINLWIVVFLIVLILGVGLKLRPGQFITFGGRLEATQATNVFNFLRDEFKQIGTTLLKQFKPTAWADYFWNATGMNYYFGMVENNKNTPVGLYLLNVRPADKYFYEGSPVIVWADIRGKSFLDEITVIPSCYIDKKGYGIAKPPSFSILGEEHNTLSCEFTNLSRGSYQARVGATFNFETWAYVTYTFVDIEMKRSYELQGKSINTELDIDMMPASVYTNGPVMLGMSSMVDQPVGIDVKYNTREPILGVTLDNAWSEGKIGRVDEFIIMVPGDFELKDCDRGKPDAIPGDGYANYSFRREQLGDPRATFQSITCRLHIKDPAKLLGGTPKVDKTFIARARYIYALEKSLRLTVRE